MDEHNVVWGYVAPKYGTMESRKSLMGLWSLENNGAIEPRKEKRNKEHNMKYAKLIAVAALILAISSSAQAISYRMSYSGPTRWIITNWDMGPIYDTTQIPHNVVHDGAATLDGFAQYDAPGRIGNEDNWGIFRVQQILTDDGFSDTLWLHGDNNRELVGMFYGGVDNALYIDPSNSQQTIQTNDWSIDTYEQDHGTLTNALIAAGSGGRVDLDTYKGVGTDAAGNALANAELVLEGVSTTGVAQLAGSTGPAEGRATFTATSSTTGLGGTDMYIDVVGGTWQDGLQFKYETEGYFYPPSLEGDMLMEIVAHPNNVPVGDWTVITDGPVRNYAQVIPEPITMLAVFGGIVGLGGYIRKRRMA